MNHVHFFISGSCEIASCLLKYLEIKSSEGYKEVNSFADRCGGQNCNRMILNMLSEALTKFKYNDISLNFLVSGHSQNENDNAHSVIETACRNRTIYTTNQWEISIQMAFKKNVCKVVRTFHFEIINFKSLIAFPQYTSVLKDSVLEMVEPDTQDKPARKEGKKVYWSKLMQVKFTHEQPTKMFFKYEYDENEFHEIDYQDEVSDRQMKKKQKDASKLYKESVGISAQKKDDLRVLCKKRLIPEQHHRFFSSLKVAKKVVDN